MPDVGQFCTRSGDRHVCLPYADTASKEAALRAIKGGSPRGAEITQCVGITRRRTRKDVCYVVGHKQPTNLTLAAMSAAAALVWWKMKP